MKRTVLKTAYVPPRCIFVAAFSVRPDRYKDSPSRSSENLFVVFFVSYISVFFIYSTSSYSFSPAPSLTLAIATPRLVPCSRTGTFLNLDSNKFVIYYGLNLIWLILLEAYYWMNYFLFAKTAAALYLFEHVYWLRCWFIERASVIEWVTAFRDIYRLKIDNNSRLIRKNFCYMT